MNKLLTILLAFTTLAATSQTFLPLVKESAVWGQWAGWGAPPDPTFTASWKYEMDGDTSLMSTTYKKVYQDESNVRAYVGAIREDSGVVYYVQDYTPQSEDGSLCIYHGWLGLPDSIVGGSEFILYDFNMNAGDTLYNMRVTAVDSVELGDGIHRKRLRVQSDFYSVSDFWIEGIGSAMGLLEGVCLVFEQDYNLVCYQDSSITYLSDCYTLSSSAMNREPLLVYPNPNNGVFLLEMGTSENYEVEVLNMIGESVFFKQFNSTNRASIDIATAGVYLLKVRVEDRFFFEKIVVN